MKRFSSTISRLYAFIYLRGFKIWTSYKTQVILNILSWIIPVFTYYFVGTSFGQGFVSYIGVRNYTAFIVIGLAFQGYVSSVITTISGRMRSEQLFGTIEYYMLSPTGVFGMMIYSTVWGFILNTINTVAIVSIGIYLGVSFLGANLVGAFIIIVELLVSTLGLSMIAGGIIMVVKQGNPISFFFTTVTALLSGTVFPVKVLPYYARLISYAIPLTPALDGLRLALLKGASLHALYSYFIVLLLFDLVLIPLGFLVYKLGFDYARKKGTLSEY
ncbi:MAG: ABC transporter permease [Caldisphaeraceae archaeon]|nr:ABC transporter permease [Caldisphaeraceae archaeon]